MTCLILFLETVMCVIVGILPKSSNCLLAQWYDVALCIFLYFYLHSTYITNVLNVERDKWSLANKCLRC